ncbi:hypothetical protein SUGI_1498140 [Cryptomeria japonica]|uniref:Uncharacterized protein n=1 Tax=Cryptomeria japonica TaxID=3369 RepID=A0AAD3NVW7_CRYJA|nr:hypothetical protein SUGI_1223230 [Cryptomeria japonica]GLJ59232.1 hypothetical protein SUGI_1498140 [Cryptomeria japonica]
MRLIELTDATAFFIVPSIDISTRLAPPSHSGPALPNVCAGFESISIGSGRPVQESKQLVRADLASNCVPGIWWIGRPLTRPVSKKEKEPGRQRIHSWQSPVISSLDLCLSAGCT